MIDLPVFKQAILLCFFWLAFTQSNTLDGARFELNGGGSGRHGPRKELMNSEDNTTEGHMGFQISLNH